jgi:hypothetical protein
MPGAPRANRLGPSDDEPATGFVIVGGRGLAVDADLGRSSPLSGVAANVCTAHAVAVGANLDPGVGQYFVPRHSWK